MLRRKKEDGRRKKHFGRIALKATVGTTYFSFLNLRYPKSIIMKRNEFLKGLGLLGAGTLLPGTSVISGNALSAKTTGTTASCHLIPTETEGPFPLDLTS